MKSLIEKKIEDSISVKKKLLESQISISQIEKAIRAILSAFRSNHKILIAGNGGSAADAQHLSSEFIGSFSFEHSGLPCIALTTNTSILTGIGNDYGYDRLFSRQIEVLGNTGDIFIAISTSGSSLNLIEALKVCRVRKILSIGLTGNSGGLMSGLCDICIKVPSEETPRIQEVHILIGHIICSLVEAELFGQFGQ